MKKVLHVVGARPNFMKMAPIYGAIAARGLLQQVLVHTGQHYDAKMSDVFFRTSGLPGAGRPPGRRLAAATPSRPRG